MGKLLVQEPAAPGDGPLRDDSCLRTTSATSAARTPTACATASTTPATSRPAAISPRRATACYNVCKARFSEFKGTAPFNPKLPHDKVLAVLQHLAEGCGVRQTARLVGVNEDTVTRLALLAGKHAKATHDELVAFSPRHPRGPVR
jgi:hypothetical protein